MRAVRHDRLGQEDSFEVESSDSASKTLDELAGKMQMGGGLVAFITLLGASIALMNIMLVSVTERTREIGIRKALGATSRQLFLPSALVLGRSGAGHLRIGGADCGVVPSGQGGRARPHRKSALRIDRRFQRIFKI
uniref:ABC3 transporter permease C-terminal domain-containing protein n=1 Tax=Tanacetum cinerariifolium TaxID=118510 RepID=A0A699S3A0_TANCI|nr:hypothetical protein [Tanacetum cinerariifolium]